MHKHDQKMKSHGIVCSSDNFPTSTQDSSSGDRTSETRKMGQFLPAFPETAGAQGNVAFRIHAPKCHTEEGISSSLSTVWFPGSDTGWDRS